VFQYDFTQTLIKLCGALLETLKIKFWSTKHKQRIVRNLATFDISEEFPNK
jgi:hypothetical protein